LLAIARPLDSKITMLAVTESTNGCTKGRPEI